MAKELNVSMRFNADTSQAKAQLQDLQNQLSSITMKNTNFTNMENDISSSVDAAMKLKMALQEATNVNTGRLDLTKFQSSLKQSGMSLSSLKTELAALGPDGTRAFASLTQSIQMAELPMFRLSSAAQGLWNTFKNTMRWQMASAALHGIASGAQQAMTYVKELNKSLTDIRIVTGMGKGEMAEFAVQANKAARQLSTTTNEYAKASLIFFQQGLSGKEVTDRADVVIKMANVTGQTADTVSDQMTAIWNNFYDGSESLEHYADVLTALGAATASSTDEISQGLEKFAAIANTVGLSYEYATTALATVTAQTRQSADVVGTAFKTLFARIEGLKLGETLEDGVSLNKYSEALEKIGVNILDANGQIKDMNTILDETGKRWQTIDDTTKIAVAQTVAGVRQYSQFLALMDNWKDFKINLSIAEASDGTLQEQQEIFAEGWEAASNKARASLESIYSSIINDDAMIKLTEGFSKFLDVVKSMIKSLGGLPGILTLIFSIATKLVGPQIANGISNLGMNIATIVAPNKAGGKMRAEAAALQSEMMGTGSTNEEIAMNSGMGQVGQVTAEYQARYAQMTQQERDLGQMQIDRLKHLVEENAELGKRLDTEREEAEVAKSNADDSMRVAVEESVNNAVAERISTYEAISQKNTEIENKEKEFQKLTGEAKEKKGEEIKALQEEVRVLYDKNEEARKYLELAEHGGITELDQVQYLKRSSKAYKNAKEDVETYEKAEKRAENTQRSFDKSTQGLNQTINQTKKSISTTKVHFTSFSTMLTQGLGAISGFSFGLTGIINAFKQLSDPDTSGFEKVLGFITAASFSLPMLTSSFGQLGKMVSGLGENYQILAVKQKMGIDMTNQETAALMNKVKADGAEEIALNTNMGIKDIQEAYKEKNIVLTQAEAAEIKKVTAEKANETGVTTGGAVAEAFATAQSSLYTKAKEGEEKGTLASIRAKIAETLVQWGLNSAIAVGLSYLLPFIVLLGLLVGAIMLIVKANKSRETEEQRLQKAVKANKEEQEKLNQALKDSKQKLDDLKSGWDNLKEAKNTLKGLTKGTVEWKEQILKINDIVLGLMDKYPQLAGYVKNIDGILTIDEDGYDTVLNAQLQSYEDAQAAYTASLAAGKNLQSQLEALQIEREAVGKGPVAVKATAYGIAWDDIQQTSGQRTRSLDTEKILQNLGYTVNDVVSSTKWQEDLKSLLDEYRNLDIKTEDTRLYKMYGEESNAMADALEESLKDIAWLQKDIITRSVSVGGTESTTNLTQALLDAGITSEQLTSDDWKTYLEDFDTDVIDAIENNRDTLVDSLSRIENAISNNGDQEARALVLIANSEWLNGEVSPYSEAIANLYVQGNEKLGIDSFIERAEDITTELKNIANGEGWDSKTYGNVQAGGSKTYEDRIRQMYAVTMYGPGAKYRWETDSNGNTKKWFENAEGVTFEFPENWSEDSALTTMASRMAANIDNESQNKILGLINDISKKLDGFELTEDERQDIINSTINTGGEEPDFSVLNYDKLNQLRSRIGEDDYVNASIKKQQQIQDANLNYYENEAAKKAEELNEILNTAEMDTTDWENYVEILQKTNANLAANKEAAERVAKQNLKTSNAIFKINKAYEENKDILDEVNQKDSPAYVKAMGEMQEAVNDWYDTALSYEEIEKLWDSEVLQKAIEGDIEAIKDLSLTLANDIVLDFDVNLNDEDIYNDMEVLKSTIQQMQEDWDDIEIGATANLDIGPAIEALNELLKKNQITAEEATRYLNSIGYDPKVDWKDMGPQKVASGTYKYTIGTKTFEVAYENWANVKVPVINAKETNFAGFSAPPTPASVKSSGEKTKDSGEDERSPKDNKALEDELDRYHYIREVLEDISNELDAVGKAKDRAFGAAKLKNMDKEIALLKKQAAAEKQYIKEIEDYYAQDRKALAEYGATFDEQGRVSNYESLMKAYVDQYNEGVAKYNSGAIDDDQFQAYEDNFQKFKELLDQYEETNNLLEEQKEVLQDYLNAIADARLEKLKYDIEVRIDLKDDDLKLLDHLLKQIEDDAFAAAERIELLGRKAQDNLDKLDVYKKGVEGVLANKEIAPEDIKAILGGDMSSVEKYRDLFTENDVETLREYAEALMATSEELQEIRKQVAEEVINNFDAWAEKVDKATEAFERLNNVLDHYKNIIGLIGKASLGISNDMIKDLNNTAVKNSINQLAASREYLEDLQVQQAEAQKHLDEARKRGIKADIEMWENTVEHINDKVNEVQENMLSNWEATLQKINEIFQENVEMALEDAKKAANGYATFDIMKDQYNKTKEQRKQYLDDYEKMVRLNELNRQISKDIDNTDNVKSQEALRDLQNEINDLQASGVKMSQYDLDYLKKRYELKKAELSIEEAQNAMSTVRLRRDDEGNWGYVYTADQSKIDDAKNNYEQKMLEMRDLSNQHIEEMSEKILEARENMANEIAAIDKNLFDSQDAYEAEVVRITEYYQGQIDYYLSEMQKGLDNNNELFDLSAEYYATNYVDPLITGNENFQRSFEDTVLGTVSDGITTTEQYGQTMKTTFEGLLGALNENYNTMAGQTSEAMKAAGTTMSTFAGEVATKVNEAGKESDKTKQEVFDLTEEMKKATTETMNWASAWQEKFSPMIEKAKTNVDKMTTSVDKLIKTIANLKPIDLKVKYPTEWPIKVPQPKPNPVIANVITKYSTQGSKDDPSATSPTVDPTTLEPEENNYEFVDDNYHRIIYSNGTKGPKEPHVPSGKDYEYNNSQVAKRYCKICKHFYYQYRTGPGIRQQMKTGGYTGTWSGRKVVSDLHSPITGATGMYTGEWGDSGRLAVLHQKELVLNAHDTENFLDGIGVLRQITNQIDLGVMNSKFQRLQDFMHPRAELTPIRDKLDQNVQITAEFPNAVYHDEIEQAFNNLIGLASQYAGRDNK